MLWFFYGMVNKDSSCLVSTTCAVYLGLSAIYLSVFFISCGHMKDLCEIAEVTKSVAHINSSISIASVINGLVWSAYSCIYIFDPYLFICSVLQILVSTAKLIVYARYYKSTPRVKSD
ncbi:hypothetical protein DY000_02055279 [Brassica cretica]|uniref:Bidirectional sugar transporter SWEET n=1 Tax=Brassica cretica TaxID=69181 RepID=A0ABQ7AH74_BRACR|nr:hypothetical protein DY000_02055279 [Brassica cretica]